MRQGVPTAYDKLGKLLDKHGRHNEAQAFLKKAERIKYVRKQMLLVTPIINVWDSSRGNGYFLTIDIVISFPWMTL